MKIILPWPPAGLSPNARKHWAPLGRLKAKARAQADWFTRDALSLPERRAIAGREGRIPLAVTFYPPDHRWRDDDNMVGSFKAFRDGIADALGVDDGRFRPEYHFADPEKPGRVEVTL